MEQTVHSPEVYDFRQYDRIWQRVAPTLEPYPAPNGDQASTTATQENSMTQRQESQLPGAAPDPCCMGSAAAEMLDVLTGFIEEELEDQRQLLALARQAPVWARQRLLTMADEEAEHARQLMAVHYLVTGTCYRLHVVQDRICVGRWCPALRERYHNAACSGLNYIRAAEGTTDPCLSRLMKRLSADEYRHADQLLRMLERALGK